MLLADELGLSWADRLVALSLLIAVAGPIIGLLFRQNSEQAGTNTRLDLMKEALTGHIQRSEDKFDNHERRIDAVELKQARHDLFWESHRGQDQSCHRTNDNSSVA